MDDRHSSTEVAPVVSNDVSQDSESQNCKIRKCHSEKCSNTRNEAGTQDVIDLGNLSAVYVETSDEDDASEGLVDDVERTETRFPEDLGSSVDYGKEFSYCVFVVNYKS